MTAGPINIQEEPELTRESTENKTGNHEMVRLFINAGRNNKIQPKHIIQGILAKTGLPEKSIGAINIYDRFTFAEVPREYATEVLISMKNSILNGQRINVEKANAK